MKKRFRFIFIMIAMLLFSYNSISAYEYQDEITNIEYLLNERIIIINDFLYGIKDMNQLKDRLDDIEVQEQLENDLDILFKVANCPTDYELAMSVNVDKINSLEKSGEDIYINADLNWLMSGYDGEFNMIKNYNIKLIEISKQLYLKSLVILND